jgi:uncharacterized protein YndB with AHSA1/START domain
MKESRTTMERSSDREIVITRLFQAPAKSVFDAWTNPEHVRRWWAPKSRGVSMASCDADVRPGGKYRYVLGRGAQQIAFSGVYREVVPPTRLVYTHVFEAFPGAAAVVTVTFEERDGATQLTSRELYPSKEALEAALASGMEDGMRETMDLLDALVAELAASPA